MSLAHVQITGTQGPSRPNAYNKVTSHVVRGNLGTEKQDPGASRAEVSEIKPAANYPATKENET